MKAARRRPGHPPRALITGGAGFIGAALTRELLGSGWSVVVVDDFSGGWPERLPQHPALELEVLDVTRPEALVGLLERHEPFDQLLHLAARVGVRTVLADPEGCRRSNLAGAGAVAQALAFTAPADRPRLWAASTSEVYRPASCPLGEGDPVRSETGRGRFAYAASKLVAERLLDEAADWAPGGEPVHLRFFNVVGPGQDAEQGMVLPRFVERALAQRSLEIHADGRALRTFAHVDQVARCLGALLARESQIPGGALNVGGRARASVAQLARCVARLAPQEVALQHVDPERELGPEFREIAWREPDLARLASLGVELPEADLAAIVSDSLARHAALCRPRESACASHAS